MRLNLTPTPQDIEITATLEMWKVSSGSIVIDNTGATPAGAMIIPAGESFNLGAGVEVTVKSLGDTATVDRLITSV